MTRFTTTMPPQYFEDLYRGDPDPWKFGTSAYEKAKYAATLAALPRRRYGHGLEIGCSIGVLTHALAERCERLDALDASVTAVAAARERCRDRANVVFAVGAVPEGFPAGRFDLIVLSEVAYYLCAPDLRRLAEQCRAAAEWGGDIVLVHWTGPTNYPLSGDAAADTFIDAAQPFIRPLRQTREPDYRLDLLRAGDDA